ncbi:LysE family transporter [Undibacterium sp. Tian12W]|uniref:LysE family transporter n=1 Tax=Undibacterium sp. Tian12W TaxID=3413054 RepID=UPI003BF19C50
MPELISLPGFILAASLVIIIPGPATLLVAGYAKQSVRRAAAAVAGIICGDVLLITLSAAGFAVLMQSLPWLLPTMRLLGAAYLLHLGIMLWRSGSRQNQEQQQGAATPQQTGFARGLLITLGNPKPVLFFSTFFPLFIPSGHGNTVHSFVALGIIFEILNLLYFLLLCGLLKLAIKLLKHHRFAWLPDGGVQKFCACGLILCSVGMLWYQ